MEAQKLKVKDLIATLSTAPEGAEIICGVDGFSMYVVSNQEGKVSFDMHFLGMKGTPLIYVPMGGLTEEPYPDFWLSTTVNPVPAGDTSWWKKLASGWR